MKILLTGAHGFIGGRLAIALAAAGHRLVCPVRRRTGRGAVTGADYVPMDFAQAITPAAWLPLLDGVDLVVNTVGIFRERAGADFDTLHVRAPVALFRAAAQAGVRGAIQFSALGADGGAVSAFQRSKRVADDALRALPVAAAVLQPSLVYGGGGASAALFNRLAALPVVMLPAGGRQNVQPVHVDDVVDAVLELVRDWPRGAGTIALCGPVALALRDYLAALRHGMGLRPRQRVVPVPRWMAGLAARAAGVLPGALLDPAALAMLERGNTADPGPFAALLGRRPRGACAFIARADAAGVRLRAVLDGLLPWLRGAVAAVWLWTAAVSLGLYPRESSLALLAQAGVPPPAAPYALYGAAALDLALGLLIPLWRGRRRRALWLAQAALILGYTAIITVRLPEFWLHPFGPMSKNLPMLAVIALLYLLEPCGDERR